MVRGMYKQAKVERKPLDEIFNNYLAYFLEENIINQSQMEEILNVWTDYAKKHLPAAQFRN
jgi:hypothetical protein